jgi:homoserine O-acetyltransferase
MPRRIAVRLLLLPSSLFAFQAAPLPPAITASLGACRLESGGVLTDCHLSYRVWGAINATRTNVVLLPTPGEGSSAFWAPYLGRSGYVDTTKFAAISVDAFGAGQSSSPTDAVWRGKSFPMVTIRDMVNAQHELLTKQLHITELHAVVGWSMGGMQAFEWAVAFPAAVRRVVSIEGTPRLANYERLAYEVVVHDLIQARETATSDDSAAMQAARVIQLLGNPASINARATDSIATSLRSDAHYYARFGLPNGLLQLQALLAHDAARGFGGDASAAQRAIRARFLVVTSPDDHSVSQEPALAWARALHADTLIVPSACGHGVFSCERVRISAVVRDFLSK